MIRLLDTWKYSTQDPDCAIQLLFPGSELIKENFSQAFQDLFVIKMLNGKTNGTYLEVGANHPTFHNNTYLLHHVYKWSGRSIEFDPSCFYDWPQLRPESTFLLADALSIDYKKAMQMWFGNNSGRVDYLQLDIDPSINTLTVLKKLPHEDFRFSVITFETDAYTGDLRARDESRMILSSLGYELIGADVSVLFKDISPTPIAFEDWWVDPLVISSLKVGALINKDAHQFFPQLLIHQNI